ncbi:RNA ligase [Chitinophaga skermanii]|uniref:RNA ligase n=1 Tax=Chitinophaga skermanii TaxID=331697 RepID=A0A327QP97_9BACT|nr:RNA ligase family protein [Chitinophaga skermanii]RAJ05534.1 RNA ligase [Chitinophaga skermanii]
MTSQGKYGRTYHYPFSPGTTSDDRINHGYWQDVQHIPTLVHTEKLDGENNCLNKYGVFARSHAAPTTSPWTSTLRTYWQLIKRELGDLEIFLENLYAVHSLHYTKLDHHFYVFAVRENGLWLSWEETKFYAAMLDLPTVPEISIFPTPLQQTHFESEVLQIVQGPGAFAPVDTISLQPSTMEGIVTRNAAAYSVDAFAQNVFKYVRKGHVKTDEHWTRNWKRAPLQNEGGAICGN